MPPPGKFWNWDPLSCSEVAIFAQIYVKLKHETTAYISILLQTAYTIICYFYVYTSAGAARAAYPAHGPHLPRSKGGVIRLWTRTVHFRGSVQQWRSVRQYFHPSIGTAVRVKWFAWSNGKCVRYNLFWWVQEWECEVALGCVRLICNVWDLVGLPCNKALGTSSLLAVEGEVVQVH